MNETLREWLDEHRFASYVALTYAISWSLFGLWTVVPESSSLLKTLVFVGGGFGPMLAAVALLWIRGKGVRRWAGDVFRVRIRPVHYLVALAFPLAALAVAGSIHAFGLGGAVTLDAIPEWYEYPIFLLFVFFLGGGQEEPGWRGYLLPVLQSRYSSLTAALAIGVVWAVWHLPLFVFPGTIQSDMAFWLYVPQVVGTSVVLTWLTNVSRGSVLPAMVLHAGANAIVNYYPVGGAEGATSITGYGLLTSVVVVVAVLLVVRYGSALRPSDEAGRTGDVGPTSPSV